MKEDSQNAQAMQRMTITTMIHETRVDEIVLSKRSPEPSAHRRSNYMFPVPESEIDSVICGHERVIKIYNKQQGDAKKKLTSTVEQWFIAEARRCGWTHVDFHRCDGSSKKACLLVKQESQECGDAPKH